MRMVTERCRRSGVVLANRTSFEIGGEAKEFYIPESVEELRSVCRELCEEGRWPFILGGGCNTLFPDGAFQRPVVSTEKLRRLEVDGSRLRAGAGVRMDVLIRTAIEAGLGGLEVFAGIPGTVGGSAVMNAGGGGHDFGSQVISVETIRLPGCEIETIRGSSVCWGYRTTSLRGLVVTAVEFDLQPAEPEELRRRAREILKRKASIQPLAAPSAGCVFKNTARGPAGVLIEQAGLKGAREGGAVVSDRHANFILNENGKASARDVLTLLERVRRKVQEAFGVALETELVIVQPGQEALENGSGEPAAKAEEMAWTGPPSSGRRDGNEAE